MTPWLTHLDKLGCDLSERVADFAALPAAQLGFLLLCALCFWAGVPVDVLGTALAILAITLTQMVLNRQQQREDEEHRRDLALHAKLDELVHASRRARDELVGSEELGEGQIERLKIKTRG